MKARRKLGSYAFLSMVTALFILLQVSCVKEERLSPRAQKEVDKLMRVYNGNDEIKSLVILEAANLYTVFVAYDFAIYFMEDKFWAANLLDQDYYTVLYEELVYHYYDRYTGILYIAFEQDNFLDHLP
jgi:hypothetical protein